MDTTIDDILEIIYNGRFPRTRVVGLIGIQTKQKPYRIHLMHYRQRNTYYMDLIIFCKNGTNKIYETFHASGSKEYEKLHQIYLNAMREAL